MGQYCTVSYSLLQGQYRRTHLPELAHYLPTKRQVGYQYIRESLREHHCEHAAALRKYARPVREARLEHTDISPTVEPVGSVCRSVEDEATSNLPEITCRHATAVRSWVVLRHVGEPCRERGRLRIAHLRYAGVWLSAPHQTNSHPRQP